MAVPEDPERRECLGYWGGDPLQLISARVCPSPAPSVFCVPFDPLRVFSAPSSVSSSLFFNWSPCFSQSLSPVVQLYSTLCPLSTVLFFSAAVPMKTSIKSLRKHWERTASFSTSQIVSSSSWWVYFAWTSLLKPFPLLTLCKKGRAKVCLYLFVRKDFIPPESCGPRLALLFLSLSHVCLNFFSTWPSYCSMGQGPFLHIWTVRNSMNLTCACHVRSVPIGIQIVSLGETVMRFSLPSTLFLKLCPFPETQVSWFQFLTLL